MKSKQKRIPAGRRYVVLCAEFCLCSIMFLVVVVGHVDAQFYQLHQSFGLPPNLLLLEYSEGDLGLSYIHNPILARKSWGFYSEWHYFPAPTPPGIGWFDHWVNVQALPGLSAMAMNNVRKQGVVIIRGIRISFWYLDAMLLLWWFLYFYRFKRASKLRKLQRNASSRVCVYCFYDMQGLDTHAKCPECGANQSLVTKRTKHTAISEPDRVDPV
jgi:hypothetical protein